MEDRSLSAPAGGLQTPEADTVGDALDILADLLEWRLPAQRWSTVEELLTSMEAAIAARDLTVLEQAVAALELAGPDRIKRVVTPPERAPSQATRERVGRTVDAMTVAFPPAGSAPAKPSGR